MSNFKDLSAFLNNKGATDVGPTHTRIPDRSLNIYGGSYTILGDDDEETFHKLYYDKVFVKGQSEYLTEKQLEGPQAVIAVDVDLRYPVSVDKRQHTEDQLLDLVELYLSELQEMIKFTSEQSFPIYVMEKKNVNIVPDKNITKDGVHIIIGIQMDHILQQILRKRILKKIESIWSDLPITNSWDNVFDEGISTGKTNWQKYGSKKPGHEPYKVTQSYNVTFDENDTEFVTKPISITSAYLKSNLKKISVRYTEFAKFDLTDTMQEEYLRAMNKGPPLRRTNSRRLRIVAEDIGDAEEIPLNAIRDKVTLERALEMQLDQLPKDKYYVKETHYYSQILPPAYYEPGSHLLNRKVAFGLKDTHDCLFLSWIMLRSKAEDFDFDTIPDLYNSWNKHFKNSNKAERITRRSIIFWAKRDADPGEFERVRSNTVDKYVEETIACPTDYDFAQVLYCLYNDRYLCNGVMKPIWYVFENHRWSRDEGETLRLKMSQEMHSIYQKKIDQYTEELRIATEDQDQEQIESCKKKMLHVSQVQLKLKRTSDKNNILKEAVSLFYDKMFKKLCDTNKYLLGFNNGVVDFKEKCFRPGAPSDYLTKNTGIDYHAHNEESDKEQTENIHKFMHSLFPDKQLHDYVWEHLASVMIGTNLNQTFNMYCGSGSNGKSMLVELMEHVLGEYATSVPLAVVCDKRPGVGNTSSELVALKGARYGVMQEPTKGMVMNEGPMKQITGGDKIQGRALYAESEVFSLQLKLCVCTNVKFEINTQDDGTWRRIRVVDFKSKFVDKIDPDNKDEYQFIKDRTLEDKLPEWAPTFAAMLVSKAFVTEGRVEDCDMVLAASKKYRQGEDHITSFVEDKIIRTGDDKNKLSKRNVQEEFKLWFQENQGTGKAPKGKELVEYMDKRFGNSKTGWVGIKFNVPEKMDSFEDEVETEE